MQARVQRTLLNSHHSRWDCLGRWPETVKLCQRVVVVCRDLCGFENALVRRGVTVGSIGPMSVDGSHFSQDSSRRLSEAFVEELRHLLR